MAPTPSLEKPSPAENNHQEGDEGKIDFLNQPISGVGDPSFPQPDRPDLGTVARESNPQPLATTETLPIQTPLTEKAPTKAVPTEEIPKTPAELLFTAVDHLQKSGYPDNQLVALAQQIQETHDRE